MARETTAAISASSPPAEAIWRPSCTGSSPSAATTFSRTQGLGLDRQQARGPRERVSVRFGLDLNHPVLAELCIQHVRAGTEVDQVEHRDVLAQLLLGDVEPLAQLARVDRAPGAPGVDQD